MNKWDGLLTNWLKNDRIIFWVLFVIALLIRLIVLNWGLPGQNYPHSQFNFDETVELYATLLLGKRIYQLTVIRYQPFFYFISFPIFLIYFLIGRVSGEFSGWGDYTAQLDKDIYNFYLVGRLFIAIIGALTVSLLYLIGKKIFNRRVGIISALCLLFSLGHIVFSKIYRLDSLMPLLLLLAVYSIINLGWAQPEKLMPFIIAGLLTGAAATTKITGLSMLIPLMAYPLIEGRFLKHFPFIQLKRDKRFPFAITIFLATVIALITPFLIFIAGGVDGSEAIVQDTASAAVTMTQGMARRFTTPSVLSDTYALSPYKWSLPWHLSQTLPGQLGLLSFLAAALGMILMLFDKGHRRQILYLLIAIIAFVLPIGLLKRAPWRDMVPILPLLALCAGYGVIRFLDVLAMRIPSLRYSRVNYMVAGLISVVILMAPAISIYKQTVLTSQPDTRYLARDWIETHIPDGSRIVVESFGPPIMNQLFNRETLKEFENMSEEDVYLRPGYEIFGLVEELGGARPPDEVLPYLAEKDIEYVVVNSVFYGRFYNGALDIHAPELAKMGRQMHDVLASSLAPIAQFVPKWWDTPGPVIQIYKVPDDLNVDLQWTDGSFDPYLGMEKPVSSVGYYQYVPR